MHIQSYTVCSTADNSWVIALSFLAGPCSIYSGATRGIRIVNENRAFEHLCMVQAFNPSPSFSNAQIPSNPGNYDMRNSQYDMVWPETGLIRLLHCRTASNTHGKFFFPHIWCHNSCLKAADCRRQQISDGGQLEEEAIQTLVGAWLIRFKIIKTSVRVLVGVAKSEAESCAACHILL